MIILSVTYRVDFKHCVSHFQGFVQFRGNPSPGDCSFSIHVRAGVLVFRLCTGETEGEQKFVVEGNRQDGVIEFFWGQDGAFDDAEVGIVLGGNWLEVFGYYFGVTDGELCPFHPPRVQGYNVHVGQVLVLFAFDQKSGGICPPSTKSLPGVQGFRSGRVLEKIPHFGVQFELPIQFVLPQLDNGVALVSDFLKNDIVFSREIMCKKTNYLYPGKGLLICILHRPGVPRNQSRSCGVAVGASMPNASMEFVDRIRGRGESIDFKAPNPFFSSVSGVLDADVPLLRHIHKPPQGLNRNWFQSKSWAHY